MAYAKNQSGHFYDPHLYIKEPTVLQYEYKCLWYCQRLRTKNRKIESLILIYILWDIYINTG